MICLNSFESSQLILHFVLCINESINGAILHITVVPSHAVIELTAGEELTRLLLLERLGDPLAVREDDHRPQEPTLHQDEYPEQNVVRVVMIRVAGPTVGIPSRNLRSDPCEELDNIADGVDREGGFQPRMELGVQSEDMVLQAW